MELRHLRYFVAVAEELHFGRAARRLHMSQPPLSQQIAALEREMGTQLFRRGGRRVELSAAGQVFLQHAREILSHADFAVRVAQGVDRGEDGELAVGFVGSIAYTLLPWILREFIRRAPKVALMLHEQTIEMQIRSLEDGRLNVGLLRPPIHNPDLEVKTIFVESFVVALPVGHPLSRRQIVPVADLKNESFITFPRRMGGRFYEEIIGLCRRAGFAPNVVQEVTQMHAAVGLVSAGIGIAIIPSSLQVFKIGGVTYRPIDDHEATAEIAVTWRRNDSSPVISRFIEVAQEVAEHFSSASVANPGHPLSR